MAKGKVRDKSKEAFWRRTVREQRQSSLTVRAFCRRRALHEAAFYVWRRELAKREAADRAARASPRERALTRVLHARVAFMLPASGSGQAVGASPDAPGPAHSPSLWRGAPSTAAGCFQE